MSENDKAYLPFENIAGKVWAEAGIVCSRIHTGSAADSFTWAGNQNRADALIRLGETLRRAEANGYLALSELADEIVKEEIMGGRTRDNLASRKIAMIKVMRERTGIMLKNAKEEIEAAMARASFIVTGSIVTVPAFPLNATSAYEVSEVINGVATIKRDIYSGGTWWTVTVKVKEDYVKPE